MQKLVTIYLDNTAYGRPKQSGVYADRHGTAEEHLQQELSEGWKIVSVNGLGGSDGTTAQGWLAVLLEKNT